MIQQPTEYRIRMRFRQKYLPMNLAADLRDDENFGRLLYRVHLYLRTQPSPVYTAVL